MAIAPIFTIDKEFAQLYVEYFEKHDSSLEDYSMLLIDLEVQENWSQVWLALNEIVKLESKISDSTLATIAAGPLESLLNSAGKEYIEDILSLAQTSSIFAKMLTGVWESEIDKEIWDKVVNFCRTVKQPIDEVYGY
jgi:hypothetical protein